MNKTATLTRLSLFAAIILFFIFMHYFFLGYTTWDGFVYRIPPIVEYLQHGILDGSKFFSSYPQVIKSFLEFVHYPFLALWGLKGLYFSFSLTLFPLTLLAVYLFIKEFTKNQRWALFGTLAFISIPFINEQPFSGYIDFAVIGALAFFLLEFLRVIRLDRLDWKSASLFFSSTLLFSFTRQQAPYISIFLIGGFLVLKLFNKKGDRIQPKKATWLILIFLLALAPSFIVQIHNWVVFGTPIYPYQLKVAGFSTASGLPFDNIQKGAGLQETTILGYLKTSVNSWVFPSALPKNFYDSRNLGAGILFLLFLFSLFFFHKYNRQQLSLLFLLLASSLIVRDFWLPRYAYGLILLMCIQIGGAGAHLLAQRRWIPFFSIAMLVGLQIVGRPFYSLYVMSRADGWYTRANFSQSRWFLERGTSRIPTYPDENADIILVSASSEFYLPLYGDRLTNQILPGQNFTLRDASCDEIRTAYAQFQDSTPQDRPLVIVDQDDTVYDRCELQCVWPYQYGCLAFQP